MLRGSAAVLVMAGHLRALVFTTYAENPEAVGSFAARVFYFSTSLGHLAVLAFFAMSGYLVGGKVLKDLERGGFRWGSYLCRRLTRLWIVILPVLVLTFYLDRIGISLTGGAGYDGRYYAILNTGPTPATGGVVLDFATLLGNFAFLQTIAVPVFGSNGPIWSLANEFWYYVTFPVAAWVILSAAAPVKRLVGLLIFGLLFWWLPSGLLESGLIWLAGAAAAWSAGRLQHFAFWSHNLVRVLAVSLLLTVFFAVKVPGIKLGDIGFGIAFAATLPALAWMPTPGRAYCLLARWSSELSYTLYLTHFPFLFLISMLLIGPSHYAFGFHGVFLYSFMFIATVVWAVVIWWCFERHTDRLYLFVRQKIRN